MDDDGCPDVLPAGDRDGDGLDDSLDTCPLQPEDFDGFKDEDGYPDLDNDLDGIPDTEDECPNEKEVFNGINDEDGCPDEGQARVYIDRSRIVIKEKIYFETSKSVIKDASFSLLNEIADLILEHEELRMIRVEGHTDSDSEETYNLDLSQARAEAVVDYFVQRGVDRGRLDPVVLENGDLLRTTTQRMENVKIVASDFDYRQRLDRLFSFDGFLPQVDEKIG